MSRIRLEKIINTLNNIIRWIFGVFFLFMSLGSTIFDHNYFPSLFLFVATIITIPLSAEKLEDKLNISMSGVMRFFVVLLLIIPGFATISWKDTTVNNSTNAVEVPSSVSGNNTINVPSEPTLVAKPTLTPTEQTEPSSASIDLHAEKTNFVKGEEILFKLSAVNLIIKPTMHVQVIIIPPSGMSVSSSEFVESGAGQYTAVFNLEPGKGKDIEVRIVANQVGNFNVNGRVIYYFGNNKKDAEDYTFSLPIQVGEALGTKSNEK